MPREAANEAYARSELRGSARGAATGSTQAFASHAYTPSEVYADLLRIVEIEGCSREVQCLQFLIINITVEYHPSINVSIVVSFVVIPLLVILVSLLRIVARLRPEILQQLSHVIVDLVECVETILELRPSSDGRLHRFLEAISNCDI